MTAGNQTPKIEYVHIVHTHNNMCSYISEQDISIYMHRKRLSMATWHQLQRLNTCILYICATMCVCIRSRHISAYINRERFSMITGKQLWIRVYCKHAWQHVSGRMLAIYTYVQTQRKIVYDFWKSACILQNMRNNVLCGHMLTIYICMHTQRKIVYDFWKSALNTCVLYTCVPTCGHTQYISVYIHRERLSMTTGNQLSRPNSLQSVFVPVVTPHFSAQVALLVL